MVRVFQGFFGLFTYFLGLHRNLYLTIMVQRPKVALIAVQNTREYLALALRALPNGYYSS